MTGLAMKSSNDHYRTSLCVDWSNTRQPCPFHPLDEDNQLDISADLETVDHQRDLATPSWTMTGAGTTHTMHPFSIFSNSCSHPVLITLLSSTIHLENRPVNPSAAAAVHYSTSSFSPSRPPQTSTTTSMEKRFSFSTDRGVSIGNGYPQRQPWY